MAARVLHFDVGADEPMRAAKFYEDALGWKIDKWEGPMDYWIVTTGPDGEPGINGGLSKRREPAGAGAAAAFECTVAVDDLDAYVKRVVKAGGRIVMERSPIPGVGWFARAQDTEGNFFGLMQPDTSAR